MSEPTYEDLLIEVSQLKTERDQMAGLVKEPVNETSLVDEKPMFKGMTYREWLAGQIMAAYRSRSQVILDSVELSAMHAVRDADALIAELAKREP